MVGKLIMLRRFCMYFCATLVLFYLILLCCANPSKELLFAIFVELMSFAGVFYFGYCRSRTATAKAGETVIDELSHQYTLVSLSRRSIAVATSLFWLAAALAITIDCLAFSAAFLGAKRVSLIIYRAVPISLALGLHPGASLEVLAGAYVEAHKYSQALPLYEEVLSLRLSTFGHNHKEIAAIYCDFGDLYAHQNQLTRAESCYRLALGIATGLLGDKGSGRAYTRLADCLRDQGRFDEATMQYQNAYDMRAHQFGRNSAKVAETLAEWAKMLKLQGRVQQAQSMQGRVELIQNQHREPSPMWGALFSLTILVLSLLGSNFLLGRKGLLTELVVAKMKAAVDAASASGLEAISSSPAKSLSRSQVSRLVTLYRFQRKDDEAEHYSALLLSMGKD